MKETDKILEKAKKCFKQAVEAEQKQRERERDDLRFQVPDMQWDEAARRQRLGTTIAGVPTPPRPVLSVSKLDQPIQLILNQQRNAHLGIKIQPLSPEADDEVAEVIGGLYRSIERDSNANQARAWAFDRAVKAGRGAYRINTKYDEQGGHPFDQVITIERILNQDSVYFDPAAQKPDFSDGEWAFITSWVPIDRFKEEFPKAETASGADDRTFQDQVISAPEWVRGDGEDRAVLVAEYFYKIHTKVTLYAIESGEVFEDEGQIPKGMKAAKIRERDDVTVMWAKMTGFEVLEGPSEWNGRYIPIVPVLGRELQPFDQERRWTGVIGPAKDSQRTFNFALSTAVEMTALEPKAPWIGAEGQFENHESEWQQANIRNFPYLEYKPTTIGDKPAPPPQRAQVDVGRLGPSMALLQQADGWVQATTSTFDPTLGRTNQRERSGRAIMALQEQSDAGNSNYLQSLADISMPYEAKVVLDLIPSIYDRPGRLVRTLDNEDDTEQVMLNMPFVVNPHTKRPVPVMAPPGTTTPAGKVQFYDLRKGIYAVAVSVGRSRQTLVQEGAEEIGQILQAAPQLMPLIGPIYFKFRDFPGADQIAEMLGKLRDKQFPGLMDGDNQTMTPEQMQTQMQAMGQQLKVLQAQLAMAMKEIETESLKNQTTLQKAQIDAASKAEIARLEQLTKLQIEELKAGIEGRKDANKDKQAMLQRTHERDEGDKERAHDVAMAVTARAQDIPEPLEEPLERPQPV